VPPGALGLTRESVAGLASAPSAFLFAFISVADVQTRYIHLRNRSFHAGLTV
jgi:hypothetical protein